MFSTLLLIAFLLVTVVAWHYWALRMLKRLMPEGDIDHAHFLRVVLILVLLVCVHLVEIFWFTGGIYVTREVLETGDFTAAFDPGLLDYCYASMTSYTTMGKAEFSAVGGMKLVTGFEALIGFVTLTWSATFFYSVSHHD